jgi:phosphatidylglycerophosphate synthase
MSGSNRPSIALIGANVTKLWGMTQEERVRRIAAKADRPLGVVPQQSALLAHADFAWDPAWLVIMDENPDAVVTVGGKPILASPTKNVAAIADMMAKGEAVPLVQIAYEGNPGFYNKKLRKVELPFLTKLVPDSVKDIERASYFGAYKGVTDVLTKYLWPELALLLTRLAARLGITPNMVTAMGALFNVLAMVAFWQGSYGIGIALGFVFMVFDTVDGKLARCTITSSGWGEFFDHGIDLVHPPFWWWAWGMGLSVWGLALSQIDFVAVMAAIVIGYVVQRLIEGVFIARFGMDMHVWARIDSQFRLITARRNPNMVILFFALLMGRPDIGLLLVAWWTVISCAFHAVRLVQALFKRSKGHTVQSWMEVAQ